MKRHKKCRQKSAQEPPLWQTKTGRWPDKSPAQKPIEIISDMTNPELVKKIREINRDAKLSHLVVKPSNPHLKRKICKKNSAAAQKG